MTMCALVSEGSRCRLCDRPIDRKSPFFATSGIASFSGGPSLSRFCDAPLHWECYEIWPERPRFAKGYFNLWVQSERENPCWGTVFLDDEVQVTVNPTEPVEEVSVNLAAIAYQLRIPLKEWTPWIQNAEEFTVHLPSLVRRTLLPVLPRLRARLPSSMEVRDGYPWDAKAALAERLDRSREHSQEDRRIQFEELRRRCLEVLEAMNLARSSCPHCGKSSSTFRLSDGGVRAKSFLVCPLCGGSFFPDDLKGGIAALGEMARSSSASSLKPGPAAGRAARSGTMALRSGGSCGGHHALIGPVRFSPDGSRFVAGDARGGLSIRTRTGAIVAQTQVGSGGTSSQPQISSVAWSPDGGRIAVQECGTLRLRRPEDLALEDPMSPIAGKLMEFGGGGRWLGALGSDSVRIFGVPKLDRIGEYTLGPRGEYEYFFADSLAVDPDGTLIAAGDDGGCNETAMGARTGQGEPQVTLLDVAKKTPVGVIERGSHVHQLVFDRWRRRFLAATFEDIGAWTLEGQAAGRFKPYGDAHAGFISVAEPWIATIPVSWKIKSPTIDFWDPGTFERLGSLRLDRVPAWIALSPDGKTLVTPELPVKGDFAVRTWTVE